MPLDIGDGGGIVVVRMDGRFWGLLLGLGLDFQRLNGLACGTPSCKECADDSGFAMWKHKRQGS